jgi:hypothetical protein
VVPALRLGSVPTGAEAADCEWLGPVLPRSMRAISDHGTVAISPVAI